MSPTPVWFVTGCSTGFGRALALQLIAEGHRAVITARDPASLADLVEKSGDRFLAVALDLTDPEQIAAAVQAARDRFGRVDVLVNNAGYGYMSSVEEADDTEVRRQFDTNVFGLFAMTRAVLPMMRQQRCGHVINITSVTGFQGFAGSGYYAASKHAVEGFSDSLAAEVAPLGIQVTCVAPGPFRTDWAGRSMVQTQNRIADYAQTAGARLAGTRAGSGKQPGDPGLAAQAIIRIAAQRDAPRHLLLGAFAAEHVRARLKQTLAEFDQWNDLTLSTDTQ